MELRYCEECGDVLQVNTELPLGPTEKFICEQCKSGAKAGQQTAKAGKPLDEVAQNLNLFSQETIALKKKQYEDEISKKPKSSRLRLVKPGSVAVIKAGASLGAGAAADVIAAELAGSGSPAKSAKKILFRCLHCRSTIAIRPVARTSRLMCPKCAKPIYVTNSGRLLKSAPSLALRNTESARNLLATGGAVPVAPTIAAEPAGSSTGRSGFRDTALKSDPLGHPAAPVTHGSSRLTKPAGMTRYGGEEAANVRPAAAPPAPAPTAKSVKPVSAFAEHQANQDPEKTAFITEEPLEDLKDLASSEALAGVAEQFSLGSLKQAPPEPSPSLGALLPDEGDSFDEPETSHRRRRTVAFSAPRGSPPPIVKHPGAAFGTLVRGAFVIAAVCTPLVATGLLLNREASAHGRETGGSLPGGWSLEQLGKVAQGGVAQVLPPRDEP